MEKVLLTVAEANDEKMGNGPDINNDRVS